MTGLGQTLGIPLRPLMVFKTDYPVKVRPGPARRVAYPQVNQQSEPGLIEARRSPSLAACYHRVVTRRGPPGPVEVTPSPNP